MSLTEAQLVARREGLGGSDCAAALGMSPWKTPLELYLEKIGAAPPVEETEAMEWGTELEPVVRKRYERDTGRKLIVPTETIKHSEHPFILGNVDGLVPEEKRLYEGKIARSRDGWGQPGTDEIPVHYMLQVQHYLLATGYEVADVGVLFGNTWTFEQYHVEADHELHEMLIENERDFWQSYVLAGVAPAPDFTSPRILDTVQRIYRASGPRRFATPSHDAWRVAYTQAVERRNQYQNVADGAKAHLIYEMGDAAELAFSDGQVLRRKLTKRKGYVVPENDVWDVRFVKDKSANAPLIIENTTPRLLETVE